MTAGAERTSGIESTALRFLDAITRREDVLELTWGPAQRYLTAVAAARAAWTTRGTVLPPGELVVSRIATPAASGSQAVVDVDALVSWPAARLPRPVAEVVPLLAEPESLPTEVAAPRVVTVGAIELSLVEGAWLVSDYVEDGTWLSTRVCVHMADPIVENGVVLNVLCAAAGPTHTTLWLELTNLRRENRWLDLGDQQMLVRPGTTVVRELAVAPPGQREFTGRELLRVPRRMASDGIVPVHYRFTLPEGHHLAGPPGRW